MIQTLHGPYEFVTCHRCQQPLGIAHNGIESVDLEVQHVIWDCPTQATHTQNTRR